MQPGVAQARVRVDLEQQQPLRRSAGARGEHLRGGPGGRAGWALASACAHCWAVGTALIAGRATRSGRAWATACCPQFPPRSFPGLLG